MWNDLLLSLTLVTSFFLQEKVPTPGRPTAAARTLTTSATSTSSGSWSAWDFYSSEKTFSCDFRISKGKDKFFWRICKKYHNAQRRSLAITQRSEGIKKWVQNIFGTENETSKGCEKWNRVSQKKKLLCIQRGSIHTELFCGGVTGYKKGIGENPIFWEYVDISRKIRIILRLEVCEIVIFRTTI